MCLSADLGAETWELGARILIPLHAGLIYSASCGIDIHASPSPFQGDFDRVTIDQLILLVTSLTFFSTGRSKFRRSNHYFYLGSFINSPWSVFIDSADWHVCVCRFSCGTCWIDRFERLGASTRIRAASCLIYFTQQSFCCLIIALIERLVVIL